MRPTWSTRPHGTCKCSKWIRCRTRPVHVRGCVGEMQEKVKRTNGSPEQMLCGLADALGSGLQISTELEPIAYSCVCLNHVKNKCKETKANENTGNRSEEAQAKEALLALFMHLERRLDGKRYTQANQEQVQSRNVYLSMQIARQMLLDLSDLNQMLLRPEHPLRLDEEMGVFVEKLRPSIDPEEHLILDMVLNKQNTVRGKGTSAPGSILSTAHACTTLRALLLQGLASGLRNDAPERALDMRWRWRHAELQLECLALTDLEKLSSSEQTLKPVAEEVLLAITLCLRNSALGSVSPKDCLALEADIAGWQSEWVKASALGKQEKQRLFVELYSIVERVKNLEKGRASDLRGVLDPAGELFVSSAGADAWEDFPRYKLGINSSALSKLCEGIMLATQLSG
eukprot:scaffold718_cov342-Pavlova_lutheri.AAC.5